MIQGKKAARAPDLNMSDRLFLASKTLIPAFKTSFMCLRYIHEKKQKAYLLVVNAAHPFTASWQSVNLCVSYVSKSHTTQKSHRYNCVFEIYSSWL